MSTYYQVIDGVAVISLANPPVNGLGQSTRAGIVVGISKAELDANVQAIVIIGEGKVFCGGADIREFGSSAAFAPPDLHANIEKVEQCTKPVLADIHGVVMGGGIELALGCHYRVVLPGTQVALPEVNIGLVPGAGGTQRLPRVLGVEAALQMITTGASVPAEKLFKSPGQKLFDRLIEGDLLAGASAFAREVAEQRPLPAVRDLPVTAPADAQAFDKARAELARVRRGVESPQRCIDCVEAATRLSDLDEGIAFERDVFEKLVNGDQARALRHA